MRILIAGRGFDSPDRHEPGIFEFDQARALRDAGHDVRFAAVDTRSLRRRRPLGCRSYTLEGIRVFYAAIPAGSSPAALGEWAQRKAADMAWREVTRDGWRPEILHAHFGMGFLNLAKTQEIPLVYTEHSSAANTDAPGEEELRRERETYAAAAAVIGVSSALARRIEAHTGVRASVIPNIVDTSVFNSAGTHSAEDMFHFVSAGNLIEDKGFDTLLAALAEARRRGLNADLTIIGDGPAEEKLRKQIRDLGLDAAVAFAGRLTREAMAALYRKADAFVLASRGETFGVVFIEAMAAGLPVIATRCGGPEDFVDDTNGLLTPVGDSTALADAMETMIRTRDCYDGPAISAAVRQRFSPEGVAARLTEVYKEILPC